MRISSRKTASALRRMSSFSPGDLAGDADREARAGERVAVDEMLGQAQLAAELAHLVLEQFAQRLDQLQFHARRQAADIVVRLDRDRGAAEWADRLDHIGIERALRQELDVADLVRLLVEHVDKGGADRLALFLGVGDAGELVEEQPARIAMDQRNVVMAAEEAARPPRPRPARNRPVSTKMQVSWSPIASCSSTAATAELTPPERPQTTRPVPTWRRMLLDRLGAEQRHRPVAAAAGRPYA